jgi:hypothetical protein
LRIGENNKEAGELDSGRILEPAGVIFIKKPPRQWFRGKIEEKILRKAPEEEALVSLSVSGQSSTFIAP